MLVVSAAARASSSETAARAAAAGCAAIAPARAAELARSLGSRRLEPPARSSDSVHALALSEQDGVRVALAGDGAAPGGIAPARSSVAIRAALRASSSSRAAARSCRAGSAARRRRRRRSSPRAPRAAARARVGLQRSDRRRLRADPRGVLVQAPHRAVALGRARGCGALRVDARALRGGGSALASACALSTVSSSRSCSSRSVSPPSPRPRRAISPVSVAAAVPRRRRVELGAPLAVLVPRVQLALRVGELPCDSASWARRCSASCCARLSCVVARARSFVCMRSCRALAPVDGARAAGLELVREPPRRQARALVPLRQRRERRAGQRVRGRWAGRRRGLGKHVELVKRRSAF